MACGVMTFQGASGRTLPFLVPHFVFASVFARLVMLVELPMIAWIRHRYMETPLLDATCQVIFGGTIVFLSGVFIGSA